MSKSGEEDAVATNPLEVRSMCAFTTLEFGSSLETFLTIHQLHYLHSSKKISDYDQWKTKP